MRRAAFALSLIPLLSACAGGDGGERIPVPVETVGPAPMVDVALPWQGRGQEPSWGVTLTDGTLTLILPGEQRTLARQWRGAEPVGAGWRVDASIGSQELILTVEPRACMDTMSGEPFPHTVTLAFEGRRLTGCGG